MDTLTTVTATTGLAVVIVVAIVFRPASGSRTRDSRRAFTTAQRDAIFARCSYRCEHRNMLRIRCRSGASHADHIVPWSRGGGTTLENGQGLCAFHNLRKGAKMPRARTVKAIARRRASQHG